MENETIKQQVRQFYDQIGWQTVGEGIYQNARYEDLRPVSSEYVHRCHLRVGKYLPKSGRYILDAGSGPIQYPEYLTYSQGYQYRVCADLSILALEEARKRIGDRGLYVVADVAHLPFRSDAFEGVVSLHTLHHLPAQDQVPAYQELYRVMARGATAAIVNGWTDSPILRWAWKPVRLAQRVVKFVRQLSGKNPSQQQHAPKPKAAVVKGQFTPCGAAPTGTYIYKFSPEWLKQALKGQIPYEIRCWRSVNVHFLRAAIRPRFGGRFWLRILYRLEDWFPHYFGEKGQYPLILLRKP